MTRGACASIMDPLQVRQMTASGVAKSRRVGRSSGAGWRAAMLEFEHQAEHWDTPEHGETGHLIAQALRAAVDIAQSGGLRCDHRDSSLPADLDARSPQNAAPQTTGNRRHRQAA